MRIRRLLCALFGHKRGMTLVYTHRDVSVLKCPRCHSLIPVMSVIWFVENEHGKMSPMEQRIGSRLRELMDVQIRDMLMKEERGQKED